MFDGNVTDEIDTARTVLKCALMTQEREGLPCLRSAVIQFMAELKRDHSPTLYGDMIRACKDLLKGCD